MGDSIYTLEGMPADDQPYIDWVLTVGKDESVRYTNGSYLNKDVHPYWLDILTISTEVSGELTFGEGFSQGFGYDNDVGPITVWGTLRIIDFELDGIWNSHRISVREGAQLVVEQSLRSAGIGSAGEVIVEPHASIDQIWSESDLLGEGVLRLGESASYAGGLSGHTVFMKPGSQIFADIAVDNTIHFPVNASASFRWPEFQMRNNEFIVPVIADEGNACVIDDVSSQGGETFIDCVFTLEGTPESQVGDADLVLTVNSYTQFDLDILTGNQLNAPDPDDDRAFVMRWNGRGGFDWSKDWESGIYLLTVPQGWCPADLNFDGVLDVFDVFAYLQHYQAESPWANLTLDMTIDMNDVFVFLDQYAAGCD